MSVGFYKTGVVKGSGMEIGANLIKQSTSFKVPSCGTGISGGVTQDGYLQIIANSGNNNWLTSWWNVGSEVESQFAESDPFTISFVIRSTTANDTTPPTIYIKSGMGYYSMIGTVTNDWSTIYYTGTWKKANTVAFHLGWAGRVGTYQIKAWKLETGTKATPWIPNENDQGYIQSNHAFIEQGNMMSVYENHIYTKDFIEF